MPNSSMAECQLDVIARTAATCRRWQRFVRQVRVLLPAAAGGLAALALLARFEAWPRATVLLPLAGIVLVAGLTAWKTRRSRTITPALVEALDHDARLGGALSSAHWFATTAADDAGNSDGWVAFHVDQATREARAVDWRRVYPVPATRGSSLAAAVLALTAVLVTWTAAEVPGRSASRQALAQALAHALDDPRLSDDVRVELSALMRALDAGTLTDADVAHATTIIDLATADPERRSQWETWLKDAAARRSEAASSQQATSPPDRPTSSATDDRGHDERRAEDWARDTKAARDATDTPGPGGKNGDDVQPAAMANASAASGNTAGGAQSQMGDSSASARANQVMLSDRIGDQSNTSGASAGGSSQAIAARASAELTAAGRREVIEAHDDVLGADVKNEQHRRKAEQTASALAYRGGTGLQTFDRARIDPPPPVPDSRRALIDSYFTRR